MYKNCNSNKYNVRTCHKLLKEICKIPPWSNFPWKPRQQATNHIWQIHGISAESLQNVCNDSMECPWWVHRTISTESVGMQGWFSSFCLSNLPLEVFCSGHSSDLQVAAILALSNRNSYINIQMFTAYISVGLTQGHANLIKPVRIFGNNCHAGVRAQSKSAVHI